MKNICKRGAGVPARRGTQLGKYIGGHGGPPPELIFPMIFRADAKALRTAQVDIDVFLGFDLIELGAQPADVHSGGN